MRKAIAYRKRRIAGRIALVWAVLLVFCHVLARAAEPFASGTSDSRVIASGRRT